jgi:hypothetical protein
MRILSTTLFVQIIGCVAGSALVAQDKAPRLVIDTRALPTTTDVTLHVAGEARRIQLGADHTATTMLPASNEKTLTLAIESHQAGGETHAWSKTIELNGSGNLVYVLNLDGSGKMGQWPAVTWDGTGPRMDVLVNGTVVGSTRMTRGIEPDREQVFVWRQGDSKKCEKKISLPMNTKRSYVCNPATGVVSDSI